WSPALEVAWAQGSATAARQVFTNFEKLAPNAPLLPLVKLAVARTWEEEGNWTNAEREYAAWLGVYTNHEGRALAEFSRAQAASKAGDQAGAMLLFTNFIAHFPT